jgi:hypothetical protein
MFSKSNLLATLAGGIYFFIAGYLIWGVLTVDFFTAHAGTATGVMKNSPDMIFIALGCLVQALFLSTLYSKWARGVHTLKQGIEFGALVGAFLGLGLGLLWYGTSNLRDLTGVFAEAVLDIVFVAIGGAIIAVVYKATSTD